MNDEMTMPFKNPANSEFLKAFEKLTYRNGHHSEVFEDFLDFCLFYLSLGEIKEPMELLQKKYKSEFPVLMRLFELLGDCSDDYTDFLGSIYMEISSTYKAAHMGQYFTPDPIAEMMARITLYDIDTEREGQQIADPACGSGVMILRAASQFGEKRHLQQFTGADIDRICCKMCTINMALNTIPGTVFHANTLSLEHFGAYTIRLSRLAAHWITIVEKWPSEAIDKINDQVKQHRTKSDEEKKMIMEQERERQRQQQIENTLKKRDIKRGFEKTLFD